MFYLRDNSPIEETIYMNQIKIGYNLEHEEDDTLLIKTRRGQDLRDSANMSTSTESEARYFH